jgi:hypothetical protein
MKYDVFHYLLVSKLNIQKIINFNSVNFNVLNYGLILIIVTAKWSNLLGFRHLTPFICLAFFVERELPQSL